MTQINFLPPLMNGKKAIITPVLKKGSAKDKNNYRPVSCLMVLSKVLERVVVTQITEYMEVNDLLPDNQRCPYEESNFGRRRLSRIHQIDDIVVNFINFAKRRLSRILPSSNFS